ncbi:MAG TPA: type II secretion system protein GspC [Archangium sp.]|nr:type II secretion system protein GspC [Archangium sp.]
MSTHARRSHLGLTLLCLAVTSLVAAHSVNTVLDAWLQPLPSFEDETAMTRPAPKEELPTPLALAPLARYLGLPDKLREEVIAAPDEPGDEPVPTTLALKLLGTLVSTRPTASIASVYEGTTQRTVSVWMGAELQGAQVVAIERTRVLLSNAGRLEFVSKDWQPGAPGKEQRPTPPQAAPSASAEPGVSVRQVGPGSYEVSRQELDAVLANPNQLLMQARVIPSHQGFKMFSIRPDSLYARIGLQNGDVLQRINGLTINNVQDGLMAFHKLRESPRIELEVERNGQSMRMNYAVQ